MKYLILLLAFSLSACTGSILHEVHKNDIAWLEDGQISISKAMPGMFEPDKFDLDKSSPLAFMPNITPNIDEEKLLVINTEKNTLVFFKNGNEEILNLPISFNSDIQKGHYSIMFKQEKPLWYASDEYFTTRNLEIPSSSDRYLKGAYGDMAIFLDNGLAIFNSQVKENEVDGISVESGAFSDLFNLVQAEQKILIK